MRVKYPIAFYVGFIELITALEIFVWPGVNAPTPGVTWIILGKGLVMLGFSVEKKP